MENDPLRRKGAIRWKAAQSTDQEVAIAWKAAQNTYQEGGDVPAHTGTQVEDGDLQQVGDLLHAYLGHAPVEGRLPCVQFQHLATRGIQT